MSGQLRVDPAAPIRLGLRRWGYARRWEVRGFVGERSRPPHGGYPGTVEASR